MSLSLQSTYLGITLSVGLYAVGAGFFEVLISPIVDAISLENKGMSMSLLHSFYCWGQLLVALLTTILLVLIGNRLWFYIPILWAILPLFNLISLSRLNLPETSRVKKSEKRSFIRLKLFVVLLVMMLCAGASELTMSQWASAFSQLSLHLPVLWGNLAGPVLFSLMMGLGRIFFAFMWDKVKYTWLLVFCGTLCAVCYLVAVFSGSPLIGLLACALTGFAVSAMWPYTFSISSQKMPNGGTFMFGGLAILGDLGGAIGPWIAGLVSSGLLLGFTGSAHSSIRAGLLFSVIFPVVFILAVLIVSFKFQDENKE